MTILTITAQEAIILRQTANTMPTNWWGRINATPLKFYRKPSEAAFSTVSSNFDKCRPEVADDVISSEAVDYVGMDVCEKFGDSILNIGRII